MNRARYVAWWEAMELLGAQATEDCMNTMRRVRAEKTSPRRGHLQLIVTEQPIDDGPQDAA